MTPVSKGELAELLRSRSDAARKVRAKTEFREPFEIKAFRWAVLNRLAIEAVSNHPGCIIVK
jgi:hypothetical protein